MNDTATYDTALDFLLTGEERHRIEFEGGHWIEILPHVTVGQRQAWSKVATKTKQRIKFSGSGKKTRREGETEIDFDNGAFLSAMLIDIVKGWSSPQPLTAVNISRMPEWMVDRIQKEFTELNPAGDEEDDEAAD